MTFFAFCKKFPHENAAIDFIVSTKYKDGYVCPKCGRCLLQSYTTFFILTTELDFIVLIRFYCILILQLVLSCHGDAFAESLHRRFPEAVLS